MKKVAAVRAEIRSTLPVRLECCPKPLIAGCPICPISKMMLSTSIKKPVVSEEFVIKRMMLFPSRVQFQDNNAFYYCG